MAPSRRPLSNVILSSSVSRPGNASRAALSSSACAASCGTTVQPAASIASRIALASRIYARRLELQSRSRRVYARPWLWLSQARPCSWLMLRFVGGGLLVMMIWCPVGRLLDCLFPLVQLAQQIEEAPWQRLLHVASPPFCSFYRYGAMCVQADTHNAPSWSTVAPRAEPSHLDVRVPASIQLALELTRLTNAPYQASFHERMKSHKTPVIRRRRIAGAGGVTMWRRRGGYDVGGSRPTPCGGGTFRGTGDRGNERGKLACWPCCGTIVTNWRHGQSGDTRKFHGEITERVDGPQRVDQRRAPIRVRARKKRQGGR